MTTDETARALLAIDGDKPVPRIEKNPDNDGYKFIVNAFPDSWLLPSEYDALNELARSVGATDDLPIYKPTQGKWLRLPHLQSFPEHFDLKDRGAILQKLATELPVKIWRYTR
jgi:hypothetical protein